MEARATSSTALSAPSKFQNNNCVSLLPYTGHCAAPWSKSNLMGGALWWCSASYGFVAFFTLILIAMGEPIAFLDVPSLLIASGCPLGMLLLGGSNLPVMIKSVLSSNASPEELRAGISGWQRARVYYLAAGIACVLAGVVIVLKNIDNPAAIGPSLDAPARRGWPT